MKLNKIDEVCNSAKSCFWFVVIRKFCYHGNVTLGLLSVVLVYVSSILRASFLLSKLPACFICRYTRPLQRKPDFRKFQESGALESGIQLKGSGILLTIGIGNPSSTYKEPGFGAWKSGIHCVESRIQDCLGFPWIPLHGANTLTLMHEQIIS